MPGCHLRQAPRPKTSWRGSKYVADRSTGVTSDRQEVRRCLEALHCRQLEERTQTGRNRNQGEKACALRVANSREVDLHLLGDTRTADGAGGHACVHAAVLTDRQMLAR